MKKSVFISIVLLIGTIHLFGQVPVIKTPEPAKISPVIIGTNPHHNSNHSPNIPNFPHNPTSRNPLDMYERDRMEVERRNMETQRMLFENYSLNSGIQYDLPSYAGAQGTEQYQDALGKLSGMLNGTVPLDLKDAVFLVENTYFEGQMEKSQYDKAIQELLLIARQKASEDKFNWDNPITKNVMLFRVLSDTLTIKNPSRERGYRTSLPMQYDFEDYRGAQDWSKMFVSKLLVTKKGQCHSLPLLYLILCEEAGTDANLAYSPSHSYIKFQDKTGNWYNLELTNGRIVSDAFIVGSGFVTSEAIKNGTYLEAKTKKQTIAQCLSDLAMGYVHKYGYDNFVNQCTDTILKHDPNNLSGLMLKANYQTNLFEYVVNQVGRPHPDILKEQFPEVYQLLEERNITYRDVDNTGFREMPQEAYEHWLNSVNEEKEKQEHNEKYNRVLQFSW